jgi:hypothetical protein
MFIIGTANIALGRNPTGSERGVFFLSFLIILCLDADREYPSLITGCFVETGAAIILFTSGSHPHQRRVSPSRRVYLLFNLALNDHPPVGICLFVGCSIARISIEKALKGDLAFHRAVDQRPSYRCYPEYFVIVPKIFKIGV